MEILVLPNAGMRWLIVAVLGAFHGLYFELFLRTTGYHAFYVLGGAVFVAAVLLGSVLVAAIVALGLSALLASIVPAIRASLISPFDALRTE